MNSDKASRGTLAATFLMTLTLGWICAGQTARAEQAVIVELLGLFVDAHLEQPDRFQLGQQLVLVALAPLAARLALAGNYRGAGLLLSCRTAPGLAKPAASGRLSCH